MAKDSTYRRIGGRSMSARVDTHLVAPVASEPFDRQGSGASEYRLMR